ncbi:hypothetical protein Scep_014444 [Stephania cephalantha]|uniref:Uncharacterized protein n=1 Tax=Stephania cephalantha TaxID=152367 RepID=A0AAP0J357_9MAGN
MSCSRLDLRTRHPTPSPMAFKINFEFIASSRFPASDRSTTRHRCSAAGRRCSPAASTTTATAADRRWPPSHRVASRHLARAPSLTIRTFCRAFAVSPAQLLAGVAAVADAADRRLHRAAALDRARSEAASDPRLRVVLSTPRRCRPARRPRLPELQPSTAEPLVRSPPAADPPLLASAAAPPLEPRLPSSASAGRLHRELRHCRLCRLCRPAPPRAPARSLLAGSPLSL